MNRNGTGWRCAVKDRLRKKGKPGKPFSPTPEQYAKMLAQQRKAYSQAPERRIWRNMIDRCSNPKHARYADYGGRGIAVHPHWLIFENFLADMGRRPEGTTLDRIDNDRGYEPGNVKWGTPKDQANNRRPRRRSSS